MSLGWTDHTAYIRRPESDFRSQKKTISYGDCSPIHAMVTLLYRMLQSTLKYDTVIRCTRVIAAGENFAFKIAAKPLQIETWLLLTAYRNSSLSYPTVPSPTSHDLLFSHNTCVTDKRHTERQTT